jgi:hypothetical protein
VEKLSLRDLRLLQQYLPGATIRTATKRRAIRSPRRQGQTELVTKTPMDFIETGQKLVYL